MSVADIRRAFVEYREIAAHWATQASGQAAPALDGALDEESQLVYTRHVHTAAAAAQACAAVADLYWRELNA